MLLPPFNLQQVETALRGLRMAPLLDGVRGDAPMDVKAFAEVAVSVGRLMMAAGSSIEVRQRQRTTADRCLGIPRAGTSKPHHLLQSS